MRDLAAAAVGVNTQGVFTKIAGQVYSQEFEQEADYVGLYVTALAGFNIDEAPYFWRKMGAKHPGSIKKIMQLRIRLPLNALLR